jgi:hypothetical protein
LRRDIRFLVGITTVAPFLRKLEVGALALHRLGERDVFGEEILQGEDIVGRSAGEDCLEGAEQLVSHRPWRSS